VAVVCHEGSFYAFSGRCPHANYLLNYTCVRAGDRIVRSSHMTTFDLKTGKVLDGPANTDLCLYSVRVEGDEVFVSTTT
jgi:nitrite reductase/ring-hydroxylating ferredoxin subunit